MSEKNSKSAFTLIELLVVIAIIGLLTTLVLVNTSGARGRAQVAKALEYSSQIYNALGSEAVGIWNLDNGMGTVAYDTSGYGNNGAIDNGAFFATDTPYYIVGSGTGKYSVYFDGTDDRITVNGWSGVLLLSQTVEFWFKGSSGLGSNWEQRFIERTSGIGRNPYIYGGRNGESVYYELRESNNTYHSLTTLKKDWDISLWYHFAGTYDAVTGEWKIYINGQLDNQKTDLFVPGHPGTSMGIGRPNYKGFIDDVRIYNIVLSSMEIQKHYVYGLTDHLSTCVGH